MEQSNNSFTARNAASEKTECQIDDARSYLGCLNGISIQSKLLRELSSCNFSKSNVSESHLKIHFNHGATSGREFTQALADHIDELLLVWNRLGGLVDVVGFHGKEKWLQR